MKTNMGFDLKLPLADYEKNTKDFLNSLWPVVESIKHLDSDVLGNRCDVKDIVLVNNGILVSTGQAAIEIFGHFKKRPLEMPYR